MTIDEKLAQLGSAWVFQIADAEGVQTRLDRGRSLRTGSATSPVSAARAATRRPRRRRVANEIQRHLVEHTRLGIPAIVHEEICSGLMAREATVFPQALGVAATFDPALNRRLADAVRSQMRAIGAHQGLSPVLDVCRDPRWGRTEETYGEDPYLVAAMGVAFVARPPGRRPGAGVIATAKHFVGLRRVRGRPELGARPPPGARAARRVPAPVRGRRPRRAASQSVMNAYNEIDGVPCGANRWLLHEVLRDEWGFDGTVVSDYFA